MLEFVTGDFFDFEADIRINTVNCVGVMGAGVALAFKNRYPDMFKDYFKACKNKEVAPGKPHVWIESNLISTSTIINFPTKIHWRNPSEYEYIEKGLVWLQEYLIDKKEAVVTLPALGCGHGGLDWTKVKEMIVLYLANLDAKILVFNPSSSTKRIETNEWTDQLAKHNVITILPNDEAYPKEFLGRSSQNFYCIGNVNLLKEKKLSILANNRSSEKEVTSLIKVIDEVPVESAVLLLGLKNKNDYEFARTILEKGFRAIFIMPYGILKFKDQKDFQINWDEDKTLLLSTTKPDQEWKIYESSNALKFRQKLANVTIINSMDLNAVDSLLKYLKKPYNNMYYINYWYSEQEVFKVLKASKIGINNAGKANTVPLLIELEKSH